MFVTDVNDVKIYNLSAGKSLPNWLTDEKRRKILKKNVDLRNRIELIQEFEMPDESGTVSMSPDQQFIIATGTYKPRVKCFEVQNLSLKFERCFDSEIVAHTILSEDYSKMVFLSSDRFIEFHAAHGRHYRLRIPRCGYDMGYHTPTCDLFVCGASTEVYRLNLERGQFLQPLQTNTKISVNALDINPEHHLLCVGTQEGTIEAWDPRDRSRCGVLDIARSIPNLKELPSVTAIKFKNGLEMGIGTSTGHVLVYDIRANHPIVIKDHFNKKKIKKIQFNPSANAVCSMDGDILKIWDETSGKQIAYIESTSQFNDFCTIQGSGMFFLTQQSSKMLSYYIPHLGPAPRWCSFLDNLTEEIESETVQNIYDDYKFVTKQELEALGLEHLEGTNLLRSYMHGFFVDIRLYNKAKAVVEPFAFEKYRKDKIRQQIEAQRPNRLQIKSNLPKVNQELALHYMDAAADGPQATKQRKGGKEKINLLEDDRFKAAFENTNFEIDKNDMEYKMLTPVLSRHDKKKIKELKRQAMQKQFQQLYGDDNGNADGKSSDDDLYSENDEDEDKNENNQTSDEESSDDEDNREFSRDMKKQYKQIQKDKRIADQLDEMTEDDDDIEDIPPVTKERQLPELPSNKKNKLQVKSVRSKKDRYSLADRVKSITESETQNDSVLSGNSGNRQMTFNTLASKDKDARNREIQLKKHREERKGVIRSVKSLRLKKYIPK